MDFGGVGPRARSPLMERDEVELPEALGRASWPARQQHLVGAAKSVEECVSEVAPAADVPRLLGLPLKWVSLLALTVQTPLQAFMIKWARRDGAKYLNSTVVIYVELLKLFISAALVFFEASCFHEAASSLRHHLGGKPLALLKVSVPALVYTVQNNLMYFSLDSLSLAAQQVTYQLKILTTAVLVVVMLGRKLSSEKWLSLFILVLGVVAVQWPRSLGEQRMQAMASQATPLTPLSVVDLGALSTSKILGFSAVVAACFTSGFAGVYMEKILKQNQASIWARNVQLAFFGVLTALFAAFAQDGAAILENGLTQGYSFRVWGVVVVQAAGGLMAAAVLKYADNILRQFSTALSLIITSGLSIVILRDTPFDFLFLFGVMLTLAATYLYNNGWSIGVATAVGLKQ